ncbi:uncharacterized, partial [Tachysurus ichikawai]
MASHGAACPVNSTSFTRGLMPHRGASFPAHSAILLENHTSTASSERSATAGRDGLGRGDNTSPGDADEMLEDRRRDTESSTRVRAEDEEDNKKEEEEEEEADSSSLPLPATALFLRMTSETIAPVSP